MSAWIGVDPGGKYTGIVAVADGTLVHHVTVSRLSSLDGDGLVNADYAADVRAGLIRTYWELKDHLGDRHLPPRDWSEVHGLHIAIEDLVAPNPHVGMSNPSGVIGAGVIAGAVLLWSWEVAGLTGHVLIRPAGHGSAGTPHAYPQALHDPRGRCKQGKHPRDYCDGACVAPNGTQRHTRSAFDVYLAARQQQRTKEAS